MAEIGDDIFTDIDEKTPSGGNGNKTVLIVGIILFILVGGLVAFFSVKGNIFSGLFSGHKTETEETTAAQIEYIDFAERFAVAVFNISYTSFGDQVQKASDMMDEGLFATYKEDFLNADFRQKLTDQKAYITYQKINHAVVDSVQGDQVVVKVDGMNLLNSDLNGSQIQLPFSFNITIMRIQGKLKVVNFRQRL